MTGDRPFGRPTPASAVEEAAKLAEAARVWLSLRAARLADRDVWADATAEQPAAPPECSGCPFCAARRRLGSLSPEAYDQLGDAVGSLANALRHLSTSKPPPR